MAEKAMTREDVIRNIVNREMANQTLSSSNVAKEDPKLYEAACLVFGTWEIALKYAGVKRKQTSGHEDLDNAEEVIRRLKKMCIGSFSLSSARWKQKDRKFYNAVLHHFKSWKAGLAAAGINVANLETPSRSRRLDREKIIQKIQQRFQAGHSMKYATVCFEDHELASSASNAFNSWTRALIAAGITKDRPVKGKKWSKEKIIEAIRARQASGRSLRYKEMKSNAGDVVAAGRRHFGSWVNALKAAGITNEK